MKKNGNKVAYRWMKPEKGQVVIGYDVVIDHGKFQELVHRYKGSKAAGRCAEGIKAKDKTADVIINQVWGDKPMRKPSQADAVQIKATKLAAYFRNHNKNLTKMQQHLVDELWDCMVNWDYVKKNLGEYNLDGVRHKEEMY